MLQYLSLALGSINLLMLIAVYRKVSIQHSTRIEREQPVQNYDDSNIQNILNNRLLDIQNRRYSVRTNPGRKNGA